MAVNRDEGRFVSMSMQSRATCSIGEIEGEIDTNEERNLDD